MNTMLIEGQKASIAYDEEVDMFRGEFTGLNGGADFYAKNIASLHIEGKKSLQVFLNMCREDGVTPYRHFSGKFNVRISPELHAEAVTAAKNHGKSLNQFMSDTLKEALENF